MTNSPLSEGVDVTATRRRSLKSRSELHDLHGACRGAVEGPSFARWVLGVRRSSVVRRSSRWRGRRESARLTSLACLAALCLLPIRAPAHPAEFERIEILTQRIEAQPLDPNLYIDRAASHSHDGQYRLAMKDLERAAKLGDPVLAAYELGLLHARMGEQAKAKIKFDQFLERFPNHARALERRARLLADLGETDAAAADYERFFAVTPRPNPGSYLSAAKIFTPQSGGDLTLALAMLDRGMVRLGVIPQLQQYAIELEVRRGQDDRAIERLEALKPALGDGPEWNVQMAEILIRMTKVKQGRRHLSRAKTALRELRETPARTKLTKRIAAMEAALDAR